MLYVIQRPYLYLWMSCGAKIDAIHETLIIDKYKGNLKEAYLLKYLTISFYNNP